MKFAATSLLIAAAAAVAAAQNENAAAAASDKDRFSKRGFYAIMIDSVRKHFVSAMIYEQNYCVARVML